MQIKIIGIVETRENCENDIICRNISGKSWTNGSFHLKNAVKDGI